MARFSGAFCEIDVINVGMIHFKLQQNKFDRQKRMLAGAQMQATEWSHKL